MPLAASQLLDLRHSQAGDWLATLEYPWQVLPNMGGLLQRIAAHLPSDFIEQKPGIWVGSGTQIAESACLIGPAIIGRNCQIRHNAFIREYVLLGDDVVIGNATEVKNAILFDGAQAPHFNYIGDSIMGYKAHLGAGAILSNFKAAGDEVEVNLGDGKKVPSGLQKLGGILGDFAEIGCNAVVFPGTIIGKYSRVYPLCPVRGFIPARHIVKAAGTYIPMRD